VKYVINLGFYYQVLCKKSYSVGDGKSMERLALLKKGMLMNYQHHWILDNMPVTWCYQVGHDASRVL
jgi:transmembrane 9 superfamily protein 2/4